LSTEVEQKEKDRMLGPDEAFEIDRKDIFAHANTNLEFIKGICDN
jgi:hypothetical protein